LQENDKAVWNRTIKNFSVGSSWTASDISRSWCI